MADKRKIGQAIVGIADKITGFSLVVDALKKAGESIGQTWGEAKFGRISRPKTSFFSSAKAVLSSSPFAILVLLIASAGWGWLQYENVFLTGLFAIGFTFVGSSYLLVLRAGKKGEES